jgi:putative tryptophan/tyrosine transport system substrate-binding protein
MRRREFIALLGGMALGRPLTALAEQPVRRVGMLMPFSEHDPEALIRVAAFSQKLQELGWAVGRNLRLAVRWSGDDPSRTQFSATELVAIAPDVILAAGTPALIALIKETHRVPIVFVAVPDPVGQRLVTNLAHPDGNATGFANLDLPIGGKWLEVLKAIAPGVTRVLLLFNPDAAAGGGSHFQRLLGEEAGSLLVESIAGPVLDRGEVERTIEKFARDPDGGLLVLPDNFINAHRELIVALAERHRLPAIYPSRVFVTAGGLVSYGIDVLDMYRGAASYIDRILKGAKPGDLPVQQPTKFELVINLKTANTLGLSVPPSLLARADEVIE